VRTGLRVFSSRPVGGLGEKKKGAELLTTFQRESGRRGSSCSSPFPFKSWGPDVRNQSIGTPTGEEKGGEAHTSDGELFIYRPVKEKRK